jgi:ethanolamine ammonia-lyase small subunit
MIILRSSAIGHRTIRIIIGDASGIAIKANIEAIILSIVLTIPS